MRLPLLLGISGLTYVAAILALVVTKAPLGSGLFFAVLALTSAAYALVLARVWHAPPQSRTLLAVAFGLAVLFRIPLALAPVGPDSDMVRYLWDGRVQRLGYNPYLVIPADPALSHTHTSESAGMPSRRHRTPYPPAAQIFFRIVVSFSDSTLAMKLALVFCDLLTMAVVWRWLAATNRNEWLALAYGWHPLVIFEVAHSGHVDALGALWLAASAYWLTRRRRALASIAFVLAVATKLLPLVLAPLFFRRVRWRDVALAIACGIVLYLPFTGQAWPVGAMPNVVANIRFNGPAFRAIAFLASPAVAASCAVLLGLALAAWAGRRLPETNPAAWAWPMAVALVAAPVVYPWYLLYLTPFLFSVSTLPLTAWTVSVMPVYLVWHLAREGARWTVPVPVLVIEYGVLLGATVILIAWIRRQRLRSTGVSTIRYSEPWP